MCIERNSAGLTAVTSPLNSPGKDSLEEESASRGQGWWGWGELYRKYGQRSARGMVREESHLKLRNIDGKKKQNLFPLVALQCMPTLQLPADENPGLLFY